MKPLVDVLAAVTAVLVERFRAVVQEKESSTVMKVVARALGFGALFADVPDEDVFLHRYATTLAWVIYMPRGTTDPTVRFLLLCHELQHVVQFWRLGPVRLVRMYLTGEGRVVLETEAERARMEARHRLGLGLPTRDELAAPIRHGYAFDDGEVLTGETLLEQAATEVAAGIYRTDVGRAVDELLTAHGLARPGAAS